MNQPFRTLGEIEHSLLNDRPRRRFIIPDVLPAGPSLFFGPSGSGKTGLAIRTAVAIAAGLQWAGRPVIQGSVIYVAGEDVGGAEERMVAAARELGRTPSDLPIAMMEAPTDGLVTSSARVAVAAAANLLAKRTTHPTALIIIDTLAACFGPKSQDDATAASEYMSHADRTARDLGCAVLSIHHTGKSEESGMRGSRVFFDRADAVVKVKRGQGSVSWVEVEKMRNGPGGARFAFDIQGAEIQTSGGPISVQVITDLRAIEREVIDGEESKAQRKQTLADQMFGVLVRIADGGSARNDAWRESCFAMMVGKKDETRRKLFSKYRDNLRKAGLISIDGEIVTVTRKDEVTPLVTPKPEIITVTVTNPPSMEGGDSDRRTGGNGMEESTVSELRGAGVSEEGPETETMSPKANALGRGCGGEAPANDSAPGSGDARTGTGG